MEFARTVKSDTPTLKDIIFSSAACGGAYAELYWRKGDMRSPIVELNFFDSKHTAKETLALVRVLQEAANEAAAWVIAAEASPSSFWNLSYVSDDTRQI